MPKPGRVVSVVAGGAVGIARRVPGRVLQLTAESVPSRRLVADRVAQARVETALALGQRTLRPQGRGRENRRRQRWRVAEHRMNVVVGREEFSKLEGSPFALQPDKGFSRCEREPASV